MLPPPPVTGARGATEGSPFLLRFCCPETRPCSQQHPTSISSQQRFTQKRFRCGSPRCGRIVEMLKRHKWGDAGGREERSRAGNLGQHHRLRSCCCVTGSVAAQFAQNRYNFQGMLLNDRRGWLYRYLGCNLSMLSTGRAKGSPSTRRSSLTSVKACSKAWRC